MTGDVFSFAIDERYRWPLLLLGVRPATCGLVVTERGIRVWFGPWTVATDIGNLASAEVSGPYAAIKAIGPRVSLADRGLTFGTNTRLGACLKFHRPVRGIEPIGLLRHPGLTVTVADPHALVARLK
ncbi:hypothetical protein [Herbidospora sp. RD11066]